MSDGPFDGEHFGSFDDEPFADDPFAEQAFAEQAFAEPAYAEQAYGEDPFGDDPFADEPPPSATDAEGLLRRALHHIDTARRVPMSASVMVDRDELVDLLHAALERLPDELRRARWLLREQDELLAQRRREADGLLEDVRAQAERMVQRTEIVRQANHTAERILDEAREEARRLRHEAEDYCDQKLASFEIVLSRTLKTVQAGRQRLQMVPAAGPAEVHQARLAGNGDDVAADDAAMAFFDQDES